MTHCQPTLNSAQSVRKPHDDAGDTVHHAIPRFNDTLTTLPATSTTPASLTLLVFLPLDVLVHFTVSESLPSSLLVRSV